MLPHAAATARLQIHTPGRQLGFRSLASGPPRLLSASESMKRATRVPASTAVRVNSASNMIAKWYQNALRLAPPNASFNTSAIPTASVGAPPVRDTIDFSPTPAAAALSWSAVAGAPDRP